MDKAYDIFLESQPTEQFELGRNEFSNFFKSIAPPGWRDRPDVCEAFWKYWSSKDLVDFVKIAPQLSLLLKGDLKDRLSCKNNNTKQKSFNFLFVFLFFNSGFGFV